MLKSLASRLVCGIAGWALSKSAGSFPRTIRVECTNACNARCIICPHQRMKRPVSFMSDDLYEKIVRECASHNCREIHLHNFGEPLMDRKLEARIRLAKEAGIGKVKIFSNGSLLTEERSRGLIEAGLDEIVISFDGATRGEFEKIRAGMKFDAVVNNVNALIRLRDAIGASLKIKIACCSTEDISNTRSLLPREGVDKFSFGKIHNWATEGSQSDIRPSGIKNACSRVWHTFTILANGDVALCCLDYDGRVILGNIESGQSIQEIFRGDLYARVRRLHSMARQNELEICASCSKSFL